MAKSLTALDQRAGEPHFHELEPDGRLVEAAGWPSASGVSREHACRRHRVSGAVAAVSTFISPSN
jgi:hypothetical protein